MKLVKFLGPDGPVFVNPDRVMAVEVHSTRETIIVYMGDIAVYVKIDKNEEEEAALSRVVAALTGGGKLF